MDSGDQIKSKLLVKYENAKAVRLTSFWLFVQNFGTDEAKQLYGCNYYYKGRTALKAADVSLIEPSRVNCLRL